MTENDRLLMEKGFDLGFAISGEGWNGEYPGDAETGDYYVKKKRQVIDDAMKEMESTHG